MNQANNKDGGGTKRKNGNYPDADTLKVISSRNLSTVSLIAAPISLFFGGAFLSVMALVFGIVSLVKVSSVMRGKPDPDPYSRIMQIRASIGIGISLLAIVLNVYALINVMPYVMEMLDGGNMEDIMSALEESMADGPAAEPGDSDTGSVSVFG